jgi:hypothetical protein
MAMDERRKLNRLSESRSSALALFNIVRGRSRWLAFGAPWKG